MAKVVARTESLTSFKSRVLKNARALDNDETLPSESTISFPSLREMVRVLTPKRVSVLEKVASNGPRPVHLLARDLRRTRGSIMRDISALRKLGFVATEFDETRLFVVRAVASDYSFVCRFGASEEANESAKLRA